MAMILIKYGFDHPAEKIKLENSRDDDTIVFIQNGVFWALKKEVKNYKGKFFALKEDFLSRGYTPEGSVMELVDYNQLIDLIEKNERSIG